jgi:hypothetical protein
MRVAELGHVRGVLLAQHGPRPTPGSKDARTWSPRRRARDGGLHEADGVARPLAAVR